MADTVDSKSTEITRTGSSPVFSTNSDINTLELIEIIFYKLFYFRKSVFSEKILYKFKNKVYVVIL